MNIRKFVLCLPSCSSTCSSTNTLQHAVRTKSCRTDKSIVVPDYFTVAAAPEVEIVRLNGSSPLLTATTAVYRALTFLMMNCFKSLIRDIITFLLSPTAINHPIHPIWTSKEQLMFRCRSDHNTTGTRFSILYSFYLQCYCCYYFISNVLRWQQT